MVVALSVAFYERVKFANGGVKTANFYEYRILTMTAVPEIEVHIAQSRHKIGGIGELGIPHRGSGSGQRHCRFSGCTPAGTTH